MYYYLSIGSNIEPELNAVRIIKSMLKHFGPLISYPFVRTIPDKIVTNNYFLNSVAIVRSSLDPQDFKRVLNSIEIALGRDRNDPEKSLKDRTADIDILGYNTQVETGYFNKFDEPYINFKPYTALDFKNLETLGLPSTEGAATIHFDGGSGHIRVLDNTGERLEYWHKPSLVIE